MRNSSKDLPRQLVLPLTLIRHLPQQVVLGLSQVGDDFHDTSGRTQCTRDIFSGEPKIRSDSMVVGQSSATLRAALGTRYCYCRGRRHVTADRPHRRPADRRGQ
jgi:hypothetical protein